MTALCLLVLMPPAGMAVSPDAAAVVVLEASIGAAVIECFLLFHRQTDADDVFLLLLVWSLPTLKLILLQCHRLQAKPQKPKRVALKPAINPLHPEYCEPSAPNPYTLNSNDPCNPIPSYRAADPARSTPPLWAH